MNTERRLYIPMPWTKLQYVLTIDARVLARPALLLAWRVEFGTFFFRCGWTYEPVKRVIL